jgi:hypothetical protein
MTFHVPEALRFTDKTHPMGTDKSFGNNGVFDVLFGHIKLAIIASDGFGWEHVSVSTRHRVPSWDEMCFVKSLFWDEEDTVIQFHPPKSEYVNQHPNCLHLWRPINQHIILPPSWMVGPKGNANGKS